MIASRISRLGRGLYEDRTQARNTASAPDLNANNLISLLVNRAQDIL